MVNNAINEIKNTLEGTNSRITEAEDRISEVENRKLPGSSIHGIFQARVLEWGAIAFSGMCIYLSIFPLCFMSLRPYPIH